MPGYRKLGRPSAHRKSMLRNLVTDLFREGRIQTTDCRAKEARREAEKLITLAKRGDLHARRQVFRLKLYHFFLKSTSVHHVIIYEDLNILMM